MRYLKYLIILILLFPLSAMALENNIYIDCPSNIKKDMEFSCNITASSNYEVSALEFSYTISNCEQLSFSVDAIWQGEEFDKTIYLYTDENKMGNFNIGKIYLKALEDLNEMPIKIKKLAFGDESFNEEIIISDNVNKLESNKEKKTEGKKYYIKYAIIILIIGIFILIIRNRRRRYEK